MSLIGQDTLFFTTGFPAPIPPGKPEKANPKKEYVVAGSGRLTPRVPQVLPESADDLARGFSPAVYEAMLTDPAVSAAFLKLKLSAVNGGIKLMPAVRSEHYRAKPPALRKPDASTQQTPEEAKAQQWCDFCQRILDRLKDALPAILMNFLDAMGSTGHKLGELVWRLETDGPDRDKLVLDRIKIKPRWAWRFVVDSTLEVQGILALCAPTTDSPSGGVASLGGYRFLNADHFAVFTWLPKDSDPRGTIHLRPAYDAWNLKRQSIPGYYAHSQRWASPGLDMEMAENDTEWRTPVDENGEPTGEPDVAPEVFASQQLDAYANGYSIVHPAGSKVNVVEPQGKGEVFLGQFDWCDRQISLAISLHERASSEAKHNSKADSETANDKTESLGDFISASLAGLVRRILWTAIKLNAPGGVSEADQFTPDVCVGEAEHQDKPAMWTAGASLLSAGGVTPSMRPGFNALLGLPEADEEADAKAAEEAMKRQQEAAAALPIGSADKGKPGERKPSGGGPGGAKPVDNAPTLKPGGIPNQGGK